LNISAIIAEYNPFHKGHLYQLEKTREITQCDAVVCIMSGNFVQRGEPAIIDKWLRTEMALKNGIDLVLELPVIYSLSSAEFFSQGAVTILDSLGVINNLCFGSETGDIRILHQIAEILVEEPPEYKVYLQNYLSTGEPYHTSRSKAITDYLVKKNHYIQDTISQVLSTSNNILGIEYCKSLIKNNSNIRPFTIRREGGSYNSSTIDKKFSSATAIRRLIREDTHISELKGELPPESYMLIESLCNCRYPFTFDEHIFSYVKYKCLQYKDGLLKLPDSQEGLHNRIYEAALMSNNYKELMFNIKTKRYTYTRINRILSQFFIGFENFNTSLLRQSRPSYVRILGLNSTGAKVLKAMKKKSLLDVYTKLPGKTDEMLKLDLLSTSMYSLINTNVKIKSDFITKPIIL
jgi:predicted nucleotidyltransferase